MKILKTLKEHNDQVLAHNANLNLNGIECDICKKELFDTNQLILSNPPQLKIECLTCGFKSVRYLMGTYGSSF